MENSKLDRAKQTSPLKGVYLRNDGKLIPFANSFTSTGFPAQLKLFEFLILQGKGYRAKLNYTLTKDTTMYVLSKTLQDRILANFLTFNLTSDGTINIKIPFYSNVEVTENGNAIDLQNLDFSKGVDTDFNIYSDPTVNLDNAVLIPFGQSIKAEKNTMGFSGDGSFYILDTNENYVMEIKNLSTANDVDLEVFWDFAFINGYI